MLNLTDKELISVDGGGFTATFLNAASRAISTLLELGRNLGSALRRTFSRSICKF